MNIRQFVRTLWALTPQEEGELIQQYGMTPAEAAQELATSWQVQIRPDANADLLDTTDPRPQDLLASCVLPVTIGNLHLSAQAFRHGDYLSIGHMHQQYLVYDCRGGSVGAVDDELDLEQVLPVAGSFRQFLDAFALYAEYAAAFFLDESRPLPPEWDALKWRAQSIEASGVGAADAMWRAVYGIADQVEGAEAGGGA